MKLTKIAELDLDGQRLDVAKGGEHFHLVRADERDDYDRPKATRLDLEEFLTRREKLAEAMFREPELILARAQALLDALGEALVALRAGRDMNHRSE